MTTFSLVELFLPCASRQHAFPMEQVSRVTFVAKTSGRYDFLGRVLVKKNVDQNTSARNVLHQEHLT